MQERIVVADILFNEITQFRIENHLRRSQDVRNRVERNVLPHFKRMRRLKHRTQRKHKCAIDGRPRKIRNNGIRMLVVDRKPHNRSGVAHVILIDRVFQKREERLRVLDFNRAAAMAVNLPEANSVDRRALADEIREAVRVRHAHVVEALRYLVLHSLRRNKTRMR